MRKGLLIAGIAVLAIGAIILPGVWLSTISESIPPPPSAALLTPNVVGSGTVVLSWSGAASSTQVTVLPCSDSACSSTGSSIATASGASGHVSFSAKAGTTYEVTQSGNPGGLATTVQVQGLTPLFLIGIVLVVLGGILAALGFVLKPKVARAPRPRKAAPVTEPPMGPNERIWGADSAPTPEQPQMVSAPVNEYTAPPSPYNLPASAMGPAQTQEELAVAESRAYATTGDPPADAQAAGGRAYLKCSNCGMMNEPWLTNCRRCKRSLSSTSDG
jgi:hypothetical protein